MKQNPFGFLNILNRNYEEDLKDLQKQTQGEINAIITQAFSAAFVGILIKLAFKVFNEEEKKTILDTLAKQVLNSLKEKTKEYVKDEEIEIDLSNSVDEIKKIYEQILKEDDGARI